MLTRLPLLHPSKDTELEPAKKLDFWAEEATPVTTRLTWEAAAVAIADAMAAETIDHTTKTSSIKQVGTAAMG